MQSTGFQAHSLDVGGAALPHNSVKAWSSGAETTLEDSMMIVVAQDTDTLPGDPSPHHPGALVVSGYDALPSGVEFDSGAGTCVLGYDAALRWERDHPGRLERVSPLSSSVRRIRGAFALNEVEFWVQFTLDLGGCRVSFEDVPVIRGRCGLLLGKDTDPLPGTWSVHRPGAPVVSGYDALPSGYCTLRDEMHKRPYSIMGLPLPMCAIPAELGMHNMSPDLLGDINCALALVRRSTPELTFGAIWQQPELVYERDRVDFHQTLCTRAALLGFGMQTKKVVFEAHNRFYEPFEVDRFVISLTRLGESTPRARDTSTALARHKVDEWCRKAGHPWIDRRVEEAGAALRPLRFRKWHLLAPDQKSRIGLSAELCEDSDGVPALPEFADPSALQEFADLVYAVAQSGGEIAFDLENVAKGLPADAALVTLGVLVAGVFTVVIETHPWTLLNAVCGQRCTLLVFSPSEIRWFEAREIALSAYIFDVQGDSFYRRSDDLRGAGARGRKLHEAFAMARGRADPLYFKGHDTNAFFFPADFPDRQRSIWSYRPLEADHVHYAAADVVALLLMRPYCLTATPSLSHVVSLPLPAPPLRPESPPPPPSPNTVRLDGMLAILRRAKSDHDELHLLHDDFYGKWELSRLMDFAAALGVGGPVEQAAVACHLSPSGTADGRGIPARDDRWFSQVADEGRVSLIIKAMDTARVTNSFLSNYLPSPDVFRGADGALHD